MIKTVSEVLKEKGLDPIGDYKKWLNDIDTNPIYDNIINESSIPNKTVKNGIELHQFCLNLIEWAKDVAS